MKKLPFNFNKVQTGLIVSFVLSSTAFTAQAEPETAPERPFSVNKQYGDTLDDAVQTYHSLIAQHAENQYPGFESLPTYSNTETYGREGIKVKFSDGENTGVFESKYWISGTQPEFNNADGAWKLLAKTDSNGYLLGELASLDFWLEAATYNAGDKVKHTINTLTYSFEAKHWTKGKAPLLTKQYGGTAEEWESEWSMLNNGEPLPEIGEPEPPIKPEPPVDPEFPEPPVDPELPEPPVDPELPEPPVEPELPEPPVEPELPEPPVEPELPEPPVEPETPAPEVSFDTWQADKIYVEGDRVTHIINGKAYNFQAKYWVQGTAPFLTESHGGSGADWDTPWQILTDSEAGNGGNGNGGSPDIDVPEVEGPDVTPGEPDIELPSEEYAFLNDLKAEHWDWFFPMRSGKYRTDGSTRNMPPIAMQDGSTDVFTLGAFKKAVVAYNEWAEKNNYKQFMNEGTKSQQATEFVSFWAKSSRETSGTWAGAPAPWVENDNVAGNVWKGGMYWVEEMGRTTAADGTSPSQEYVSYDSPYKPVPGRSYYGRGIIQLSWNYNYGQFSEWLYNNGMMKDLITEKDTLLKRPDYVAIHSELAYLSGIWFWMTPQGPKPSSHDVMYGNIYNVTHDLREQGLRPRRDGGEVPAAKGESQDQSVVAYRLGTVTNIVNGGLECNGQNHDGPPQRASYYNAYAKYMNATIEGVKVPVIDDAVNIWTTKPTTASSENMQHATCYSMRSYL